MNEFKRKLEETLNRLYKENKLSIDAYSELMEFADPNQNLQLQQTGVSGSFLFEQDNLKTKDLVKISKLREDILMLIHTTDLSEKIIEFLLYPFEEILKHNGVNISEQDF